MKFNAQGESSRSQQYGQDQIPVGFVVFDSCGLIVSANRLLADLQTVACQSLPNHCFAEYVFPADQPRFQRYLAQLPAGGERTCQLRFVKKDGAVVWVRLESLLVSDAPGACVIHTAVIDITDHKATEQQLAEKESRLRTVVETIPDLVWLKDPQGFYLDSNKMFERLFGAEAKAIIGRTDYDFVDRETADYFREHDRRAIATGKPSMNEESLTFASDGSSAIFETIKTPAFDAMGNIIGVLGIARDITDRKTLEAELRQSELKFRQLVQALPLPLTIVHTSGQQEYINDRFIQVFGYDYDDMPTLAEWWELAYPDIAYRQWAMGKWTSALAKAMETGKDIEPVEYNITCKNKLVRSVIVSGVVIGELVLSTFTDISERRRHEKIMKGSFERRRKNELMNELIRAENPAQQVVFESARIMGEYILTPFSCFLFVIDEYLNQEVGYWRQHLTEYHLLQDSVFSALEAAGRIVWDSPDGIGVIVFESAAEAVSAASQTKLAALLRTAVVEQSPGLRLTVGIAEPADNMTELRDRYRQARTAVQCGNKVWPQRDVYHYQELGVYQFLSGFTDSRQLDAYVERVLGKLLQYDNKRKGKAFLNTLEVLLTRDNMKEGAEQLSIHYQTLLFRKQRIETILGVSLDDFAIKMSLLTALHLLKLRG